MRCCGLSPVELLERKRKDGRGSCLVESDEGGLEGGDDDEVVEGLGEGHSALVKLRRAEEKGGP
jgi:hypothetical protein